MGNIVDLSTLGKIVVTTAASSAVGTAVGTLVADLVRKAGEKIQNRKIRKVAEAVHRCRPFIIATAICVTACVVACALSRG